MISIYGEHNKIKDLSQELRKKHIPVFLKVLSLDSKIILEQNDFNVIKNKYSFIPVGKDLFNCL